MRHFTMICLAILGAGFLGAADARAAETCIHPWAQPGRYYIEGDFRGRVERASAQLTNSCRVTINLPGVFTGGGVRKAGDCLQFSFKVQNEPQTFVARWCNSYAIVPWNGRDMRARVFPAPVQTHDGRQRAPRTDQWK